jgi:hypothetical protein
MQEIACACTVTRVGRIDTVLGIARFGNDVRAKRRQFFEQIGKRLVVAVVVNAVLSHDLSPWPVSWWSKSESADVVMVPGRANKTVVTGGI